MSNTADVAAATAIDTLAAIESVSAPPPPDGLWHGRKIPIIIGTGEFASGKTLFGLTISPNCLNFDVPPDTLVWDTEGSSETYEGALNFERRDLFADLPPGSKPISFFLRWITDMHEVRAGQYILGVLDTGTEIEDGLADWVRANPQEFNHTAAQYKTMEGLFWGDVKSYWKRILSEIASKFETFYITVHLKAEWKGKQPTGRRTPKGKTTLSELASLYLWFERKVATGKTKAARKPSAIVLKSRLAHCDAKTSEIIPILPPRLAVATPDAIRGYIDSPPDYDKLKKFEQLEEQGMSEDDRLLLNAQIAGDQKDTAQADLSRIQQMQAAGAAQAAGMAASAAVSPTVPAAPPVAPPVESGPRMIADEGKAQITQAMQKTFANQAEARAWLDVQGYAGLRVSQLTYADSEAVLRSLNQRIAAKLQAGGSQPMKTEAADDEIPFDAGSPAARMVTALQVDTPAKPRKADYTEKLPKSPPVNGPATAEQVDAINQVMRRVFNSGAAAKAWMAEKGFEGPVADMTFTRAAELSNEVTLLEAGECLGI